MFFLVTPWSLTRILLGRRDITSMSYLYVIGRSHEIPWFGCMFRDVYIYVIGHSRGNALAFKGLR